MAEKLLEAISGNMDCNAAEDQQKLSLVEMPVSKDVSTEDTAAEEVASTKPESVKPHFHGHRKRMKEKFINTDPAAFSDYELIELLLFYAIPRRDVKPLAKELLSSFGSIGGLLGSDIDKIADIPGTNEGTCVLLKMLKELINRALAERVVQKNVISSWAALLDYLKYNMSDLKIEQFRVLFLNKKNVLIADEIMAMGTIDQTPVYPREIVKKSIYHEAGAIILVHNHPGGDTRPSSADIDLTTEIVKACATINVTVHDHVIVGSSGHYSFKSNMLL